MKILFFSHYFPPEGNAPASRTYENCKRWVRDGHDVTVITCAPNVPDGVVYDGYTNHLWPKREEVDGIQVLRVWTYIAANKGTVRRILNYVSYMVSAIFAALLFVTRPNVVIATSPQFFCGWAGLIYSALRFCPFVLEIRDIWPESIQAVGAMQKGFIVRVLEWMEHRMYKSADHIVTVGEGYRQRLLEKSVAGEKISVIMNGVDRNLFSPQEKDAVLAEEYDLRGKFVVSYIGTIGMACALDVVIRAAAMLLERGRDDVRFMLVGAGAVREELEAEAQAKNLYNVTFTGRKDKHSMPAFLSITDACLVHLKKTDLFTSVMPSKIFEAGGMARPIIMGVEGNAADIVRDAGMGVFMEPESEEDLVEAVLQLADDPELAKRLGDSGHDYIVKHFDRDALASSYMDVLRNVVGEPADA